MMRVWTVHTRPNVPAERRRMAEPVLLVREGFAWAAFLFGGLWLLAQRLWLAALAWLVAVVAIALLLPPGVSGPAQLAVAILLGAHGRDLCRTRLARLGYAERGVVAAPNRDAATARLLAKRPDLVAPMARAALA